MLTGIRHITLSVIDFFHRPFEGIINKQMFRYLACGGFNTVLNIVIFWFSFHFIFHKHGVPIGSIIIHPYIAAFIVAFVVSFPLGFALSKYIVFPESNLGGKVQIFRYAVLVCICVLLNYVLLKIFVEVCGFYPTPSNILTAVIVAAFSFISQRRFTFKVSDSIPLRTTADIE